MRKVRTIVTGKGYEIIADELNRIRVDIKGDNKEEILHKVLRLAPQVNKIDALPLNESERRKYQNDIANIYQMGILSSEELAIKYADELKLDIERNLIIRKKQVLFTPVMIVQIITIILALLFIHFNIIKEISEIILCGNIGGILSTIFYNNKLDIDYYVDDRLLHFEAVKLIILSNILAAIGFLAIKSNIILGDKFGGSDNKYLSFLVYVVCGYSQTFIPNMLKNFEINKEENTTEKNNE